MTQLHLSTLQTKPFNPIIGETLQLKIGDMDFNMEHIQSKPPCSAYYGIAKNYIIKGTVQIQANTSANSIKASKTGKYIIKFADDHCFEIAIPHIMIKGITVGKRLYYFRRCGVVTDMVSFY